jgi:hypothetical protein
MRNWTDDIWESDGDSKTRGEDDDILKQIKKCNVECKKYGIRDNFIKVAFYKHVPLWTNDSAWKEFNQNFSEAARFAKMAGCRGIALDIEYVGEQYDLDWEGYDFKGYIEADLRKAAILRGQNLVKSMIKEYPEMVFLTLPEGITFYGPLATDFFVGMVQGMAELNATGGVHLLTERSYDMTSTFGLIHYVYSLESEIVKILDEKSSKYWKDKCSIALGGWPLGYYRKITNESGEFLGYSGREEIFGNAVVGSYADKSSRFSVEEFKNQYAGLLLGCKRYCWIYGHGATWWQFDQDDLTKYGKVNNSSLPVDANLENYKSVVQIKWTSTEQMKIFATYARDHDVESFIHSLGFISNFKIIGPFGCKDCGNFDKSYPPEKEIEFDNIYQLGGSDIKWQSKSVNPQTGYLDFCRYLNPTDWVCAYAYCKLSTTEEINAQIRLGTNDTGTLWLNGKRIISKNVERSATPDTDIINIKLKSGDNAILIKVCNTELNWGLYLRITDEFGDPLDYISYWP